MTQPAADKTDQQTGADRAEVDVRQASRRIRALTSVKTLIFRFYDKVWTRGEGAVWFWGLMIGIGAAYAILGFRLSIETIQYVFFGAFNEHLAHAAAAMPWYAVASAPVIAGFIVSGLLYLGKRFNWLPETRSENVAAVIEARAVHGGHINYRTTLFSALVAAVSLGGGASSGREGPAVHLGGGLGALMAEGLSLPPRAARTLLACGVSAAIAASFDAPIAGVLFALEVVLGHYALRVIAPVAISSLAASVVTRAHLGDQISFSIPPLPETTLSDFPLAALLGFIAALVAMAFMRLTLDAQARLASTAGRMRVPLWALPPVGGVLIGLMAVWIPDILGVGYEATTEALAGHFSIGFLLALLVAKLIATAITLGFRFGGGVFSPSIFIGAMVGAAFGGIVDQTPLATAGETFFAVIGMGAVAGAVLGAPISTTLIVFELTQSYEAGAAMLLAVSIATVVVQSVMGGSIFQKQIENHGYKLTEGPQRIILQTVRVRDVMNPVARDEAEKSSEGAYLYEDDSLGRALALMEAEDIDSAAVKRRGGAEPTTGHVSRTDALLAYNKALVDAHIERTR